jgi:hypothetical protein
MSMAMLWEGRSRTDRAAAASGRCSSSTGLQMIREVDALLWLWRGSAVLMADRLRRPQFLQFIGLAAAARVPALRGICVNATAALR